MPRAYDDHRESQAEISRERSRKGRDIAPIPEVGDPARRNACLDSLRLYCETYRAETFSRPWSADHLTAIRKLETAVLDGGLFALAMSRGSGKTSLAEAAAEWAILYGHRRFVVLIGATETAALEMLQSIKLTLETSDLLLADFPEACYPIQRLEGIAHRANGQLLDGERTRITWTDAEIVLPTVPGSPSSAARVRVAGITGRVRGMKAKTAGGDSVRPDLAIADDPQTDESSSSPIQTDRREKTLLGAVKGLAGPGKRIAMVVPCTVIARNDLADRLLDRDRHPQFQGERFKMVYSFPTNLELWDRYAELRRHSLASDGDGAEATEFYRANREAMDAGAVVGWADRFDPATELSALQAAMNLKTDAPNAFAAEYQNEPPDEFAATGKRLDAQAVAARLSGTARLTVPRECDRLVSFVDVGGGLHWYGVAAFDGRFGGVLIDYGCWPRQSRNVFAAADARPSLSDRFPGHSEAQRVYAGLAELTAEVLGREYPREGGGVAKVGRCLVDAGWQPDAVYKFCRASPHAAVLYPSKGVGRSATAVGVGRWKARPGERAGHHWRLTVGERAARTVQFDPDVWKSFAHDRLTTAPGGAGAVSLFGTDKHAHALLGEHFAAETAEPAELRGDRFDKWSVRADRPDNHLWDVFVGCCVAASVDGLVYQPNPLAAAKPGGKPKATVDLGELQRRLRADRLAKAGR